MIVRRSASLMLMRKTRIPDDSFMPAALLEEP